MQSQRSSVTAFHRTYLNEIWYDNCRAPMVVWAFAPEKLKYNIKFIH